VRYSQRTIRQYSTGTLFQPCEGTLIKSEDCGINSDCKVTEWTPWTKCSATCSGGQQVRERSITQNPRGSGEQCPKELMQTQGCELQECPDAVVAEWSSWGACSVTCGQGYQTRTRELERWAEESGRPFNGPLTEVRECTDGDGLCGMCKDCKWSEWSPWSDCSQSCGGGQRERDRRITQYPERGCKACEPLENSEVEPCGNHACPDSVCQDGLWGEWSTWSSCTGAHCEGEQSRERAIIREANYCGKPATGYSMEARVCNEGVSCAPAVHCEWGEWAEWSGCPVPCQGIRKRRREELRQAEGSGEQCQGTTEQSASCLGEGGAPCADAHHKVDCVIGEWSLWSECSMQCGNGQRTRLREVIVEGSHGGEACYADLMKVEPCDTGVICQEACQPQDCDWTEWSEWSGGCCSCGAIEPVQRRHRGTTGPARCGGKVCEAGPVEEVRPGCDDSAHAPVYHCSWNEWQRWSDCSATCGRGSKTRSRFLKGVAQPAGVLDMRVLSGQLNTSSIVATFNEISLKKQALQAQRVRTLSASWMGGALSLLFVGVVCKRSKRTWGYRPTSQRDAMH